MSSVHLHKLDKTVSTVSAHYYQSCHWWQFVLLCFYQVLNDSNIIIDMITVKLNFSSSNHDEVQINKFLFHQQGRIFDVILFKQCMTMQSIEVNHPRISNININFILALWFYRTNLQHVSWHRVFGHWGQLYHSRKYIYMC